LRLTGKLRNEKALEVMAHGVLAATADINNEITNNRKNKFVKSHVLRNLKSSFINRFRNTNDALIDIIASKSILQKIAGNKIINGYVQKVDAYPFGFFLVTDIQVTKKLTKIYSLKYKLSKSFHFSDENLEAFKQI
jgi:hypothetical protein